jgi:3-deoxy-D-manno-octulosonic-acid transferase
MPPRRALYDAVLFGLVPFALGHLAWRARRQPRYLDAIGERFGVLDWPAGPPTLWLHTVSVGETRAAQPLVEALRARHPDHRVLLTHTTPTGRETSEQLHGGAVARAWLPWDLPFAVRRFVRTVRPALGLLLETELWPNLARACREAEVPLLLVNARLSARSARGYARVAGLARDTLGDLAGVAAQTEADAARLTALGARDVAVTGNLKFDVTAPAALVARGEAWRDAWGRERPVWLAASTRDGEEAVVLDALAQVAPPHALLVLVPRHPQRFDAVAALIASRGLALQRRSADAPLRADTRVLLGDSLGEMFAWYAACDVAFVGGSLVPTGGQNLIEPCSIGRPVLIGPHTFNFADAAAQAVEAGAATRVHDAASLAVAVSALLRDAPARAAQAARAAAFAAAHRGATARTLAFVDATLARRARSDR